MSIEPIELWLDVRALRRGLVFPVDPDTDSTALCIQDSGMVPVSTQIAIVNPETCQLCHIGEYGEIWVQSEACAKSFYMSRQAFDEERFNGRIMGGDPNAAYVRTGDLGFLHNVTRPIGANNQPVEMQILFVLGSVGETFEVNGLNHFPLDIETSVEKSHRNITPGGCAVFQAGGMVVVIVEVFRKAYLASIVPVIVNAVLNEHQIVVDIVAFVGNGDFPRSRLSEKQRGKILASWVTRKLRTIAQFGIRDPDGPDHRLTEVPEPRSRQSVSVGSKRGMHDPTRSSIVSESPAHMQPPQENGGDRSSYMPDLGLPPNHYQIDPSGLYEEQQSAPVVSLNDRPYIAELPDQSYRDHSPDGSENFDDDEFFDPNAQNFGNYTPQSSNPDLPGPPRLSLVNPDLYSLNGSDNNSTNTSTIGPQSGTATVISPMASRPHPLSAGASSGRRGSWDMGESPYEDQGNPFANSIPASVPSFDFISPISPATRSKSPIPTRKPIGSGDSRPNSRPTSPGPGSGLIAAVTAGSSAPPGPAPPIPPKGRALLPSQQARYNQTPTALRNVEDAEMNRGRFPHQNQNWDPASSADHQDADSKLHPDRPGTALSQYSTVTDGADLRSQAGSVRRRYDGSGYEDGW